MVISRWQCIIDAKYLSLIHGLVIILVAAFSEIKYKFFNLLIIYFLILQTEVYPYWISFNPYRDMDNLISYYSKKHNVAVDFWLSNISELLEYRNNFIILDNNVYNLWDKESDVKLVPVMDRYIDVNPDTVFFIQPNYMHDIDKNYFLESDENKRYAVSLIKTPYYYIVKLVLMSDKKK